MSAERAWSWSILIFLQCSFNFANIFICSVDLNKNFVQCALLIKVQGGTIRSHFSSSYFNGCATPFKNIGNSQAMLLVVRQRCSPLCRQHGPNVTFAQKNFLIKVIHVDEKLILVKNQHYLLQFGSCNKQSQSFYFDFVFKSSKDCTTKMLLQVAWTKRLSLLSFLIMTDTLVGYSATLYHCCFQLKITMICCRLMPCAQSYFI